MLDLWPLYLKLTKQSICFHIVNPLKNLLLSAEFWCWVIAFHISKTNYGSQLKQESSTWHCNARCVIVTPTLTNQKFTKEIHKCLGPGTVGFFLNEKTTCVYLLKYVMLHLLLYWIINLDSVYSPGEAIQCKQWVGLYWLVTQSPSTNYSSLRYTRTMSGIT